MTSPTREGVIALLVRCARCSRGVETPLLRGLRGAVAPLYGVQGNAPRNFFLDPILGGRTYLWFCAWFSHMVLGVIVFFPWYFVDFFKGTTVMF